MNTKEQILKLFKNDLTLSSGDVVDKVKNISTITIKRQLTRLVEEKFLLRSGGGRSIVYTLTQKGLFLRPYDTSNYANLSPEDRSSTHNYNHNIFENTDFDFFTIEEQSKLSGATKLFFKNAVGVSEIINKKELERFIIELSWKSSKIEGNTYTLLDTETLLREGIKSSKNTESETQMILNHKKAFTYIYETMGNWGNITVSKIEDIHRLMTADLGIPSNLRKGAVGITGTNYRPLDNEYQIREALESLCVCVNNKQNTFEKALIVLLGIAYIQPFEDGNKRTARMLTNAILMSIKYAPLSYRTVDEKAYREAALIFYEQNSIVAMKEIFIEQYIFAAKTYNIG